MTVASVTRHLALVVLTWVGVSMCVAGTPTTRPSDDATAACDALRAYFGQVRSAHVADAVELCHASGEDEQLLARSLATFGGAQYGCRALAAVRFGPKAAERAFSSLPSERMLDEAQATVSGGRAVVVFGRGQRWQMVKVDGTWKVSIADFAAGQQMSVRSQAIVYARWVKIYLDAIKELKAGRYQTAGEFAAAIENRIEGGASADAN